MQEHGETAAPFVSGWNPNKGITAGLNPSEPQESRKSRAVRRGSDRRLLWGESQTVRSLINLLSDLGQVTASKFKFSPLQKRAKNSWNSIKGSCYNVCHLGNRECRYGSQFLFVPCQGDTLKQAQNQVAPRPLGGRRHQSKSHWAG